MTPRERLMRLVTKWREEAAFKDSFHATMGIGWKACADDLDAEIARLGEETGTGLREALEGMVYQFGYEAVKNAQPALMTGGLSALEDAFDALDWDDPYLIPDPTWCAAPCLPRCPRRVTCGTPTAEGEYKWFCSDHFDYWRKESNAHAAKHLPPADPERQI